MKIRYHPLDCSEIEFVTSSKPTEQTTTETHQRPQRPDFRASLKSRPGITANAKDRSSIFSPARERGKLVFKKLVYYFLVERVFILDIRPSVGGCLMNGCPRLYFYTRGLFMK